MTDINQRKRKAIEALLSEPTIRAAAEAADLGESTMYRYLNDPEFRAELSRRQDEILTAVTAQLSGLSQGAVGKLAEALALLSDHAGASVEDFISIDGDGWKLDLQKAGDKLHLIRKLSKVRGEDRLELHDAQSAADRLARLVLSLLDERRKATELDDLAKRVQVLEEALKN